MMDWLSKGTQAEQERGDGLDVPRKRIRAIRMCYCFDPCVCAR